MKPSNTYPNTNPSFTGVLQPLVDLLAHNERQSGRLSGQEVVVPGQEAKVIIALDSEDNIHLLISSSDSADTRLERIDLHGLKVDFREWSVAGMPTQNYLDLSCATGSMPAFRRPFLKFSEDVVYELSQKSGTPSDAVYRTCIRWQRFWSAEVQPDISREWLYGIYGEILFLNELIRRFGSGVVQRWEGPLGSDHDFQVGTNLAVEVKASSEIPFVIHCNIRQLDAALFDKLFLLCYRLTISDSGLSLPDLVKETENLLGNEDGMLDKFYERLAASGYQRQLESGYSEYLFDASAPVVFPVNETFPGITERSFVTSPDHRINNIRYTLTLAGLEEFAIDDVVDDLIHLKKYEG
jgi:hypothetical protein